MSSHRQLADVDECLGRYRIRCDDRNKHNNTASLDNRCVDEWYVEIVTFSEHQIDYFIDMLIPILCYESSSFQKRKLIC